MCSTINIQDKTEKLVLQINDSVMGQDMKQQAGTEEVTDGES